MKAVVSGMIATFPVGGVLWDYGQYVLGLEKLGFETFYLEDTGCPSFDPQVGEYRDDYVYGIDFLTRELSALSPSLASRWHVRTVDGATHGLSTEEITDVMADADVFLNVSGGCLMRDEYLSCRRKVLIDTDPGWNHFVTMPRWDESPGWQGTHGYRAHDLFFTYASCIGQKRCRLPDLGLGWFPTRPPVLVDRWSPKPPGTAWTTVLSWNNYGRPITVDGSVYGSKEEEFAKVAQIPSRLPLQFELALGGVRPPFDWCRSLGWRTVPSSDVSATADDYRNYIERSRGEFSVAKNIYVATGSGWFSCRSVCYLAAGRPVVVQDTGFSSNVPTGEGLLAFTSPEQAEAALREVEGDYERHQGAARRVAEEEFDSDRVLGRLLEVVMGG